MRAIPIKRNFTVILLLLLITITVGGRHSILKANPDDARALSEKPSATAQSTYHDGLATEESRKDVATTDAPHKVEVTADAPKTSQQPDTAGETQRDHQAVQTNVQATKQADPLAGRVIALDAGHGGVDNGARGVGGSLEKVNTLSTVYAVKQTLEEAGARVVLTRSGDYEPGLDKIADPWDTEAALAQRTDMAAQEGADVFISIHNDWNYDATLTGTTTYYWGTPLLAQQVQHALVTELGSRNLGTLRSDFYVLTLSRMPAILVEVGFLSNWSDEQLLKSAWYQAKVAQGICTGLRQYFSARAAGA